MTGLPGPGAGNSAFSYTTNVRPIGGSARGLSPRFRICRDLFTKKRIPATTNAIAKKEPSAIPTIAPVDRCEGLPVADNEPPVILPTAGVIIVEPPEPVIVANVLPDFIRT